jgi:hypothetical protein
MAGMDGILPIKQGHANKKHNQYIKDHTVINVDGLIDYGKEVVLGKMVTRQTTANTR